MVQRRRPVLSCALVAVLSTAALAAGTGPAPVRSEEPATTHYAYEIWYEIKADGGPSFDAYFAKLREASARIPHSPPRWVDVDRSTGRRVVILPVARLSEYGAERYNEVALPAIVGEAPARALTDAYAAAQISRTSYIRWYRDDLSLNRPRHLRDAFVATEYTLVTVGERQERSFERLWKKALAAYAMTTPDVVLTMAQTVAGGGPEFLLMRPLTSKGAAPLLPPTEAVARAFGPAQGKDFSRAWDHIVSRWAPTVFENAGLDSTPPVLSAPDAK